MMRKIGFALLVVIGVTGTYWYLRQPSSAIPARRAFPVDTAINPCTDFYAYACGPAMAAFRLRDDRSDHTFSFDDSAERLLTAKEEFLAQLSGAADLPARRVLLRDNYQACMNIDATKQEEREYVERISREVDALSTHEAFAQYVARHMLTAEQSWLDFDTIANLDHPDRWDLLLLANLQTLPERSYYDDSATRQAFTEIVASFLRTLHRSDPTDQSAGVVALEKAFAQSYPLPEEFNELLSTPTQITKAELLARYPLFGLNDLLARISDNTLIRNIAPANFDFLHAALTNTPLPILKDLYLYHALTPYMDDAYPEFFREKFQFEHQFLGGPKVRPDRRELCTRLVMEYLGKELDAELLPQLFPDFPAERIIALAERIRQAILQGLAQNSWLTPAARDAALAKIRVATLQLVKPATEADWDFAPPFAATPTTPYANLRALRVALLEKQFRELPLPRSRTRWSMGPLTVNAYYSPEDNTFVMPIGILQHPFFDSDATDTANLGGVGMIVGHELGHGLDDNGAKFDAEGRLQQWMTNSDLSTFTQRTARLVDQFGRAGLNGKLTLGENVADVMGLTFAYQAAFPDESGTAEEHRQFFLQYAHLWCNVIRPSARALYKLTDPHAYNEQRVNEQIKQQPGFAESFACHEGDPMTLPPAQRVTIW